jgi:hypothetical protein
VDLPKTITHYSILTPKIHANLSIGVSSVQGPATNDDALSLLQVAHHRSGRKTVLTVARYILGLKARNLNEAFFFF